MNIGIIGCGNIAQSHIAIITKNISRHRLIFCDPDKNAADDFAHRYCPGPTYQTIDELLLSEKLDAVHILTPPEHHPILAEKALAAGVHVYVEKPVAERVSDYITLHELAKSRNRLLCAGYSTLGMPVVRKAKELVDSGKFGRLITVHCDFNWSVRENVIPYGRPDHWAYSLKGGILQNLVDHPTSLIVDAMNEIDNHRVIFGHRNKLPNDCPDLMHVMVSNDHQIGSYTVSFGHGNTRGHVAYSLEAATIIVDLRRELLAVIKDKSSQNFIHKTLSGLQLSLDLGSETIANVVRRLTGSLQRESGIVGLVRNFYSTIDGKDTLIVSEGTARQVIALLEQIWDEMGLKPRPVS